MRAALLKVWPGVLIPSLPGKNPLLKNEEETNKKRERYLNDFLKKVAMKDFLYYGEEFQSLLRSEESNLSDIFAKTATPLAETIVLRYKDIFAELAGVLMGLFRKRSTKGL